MTMTNEKVARALSVYFGGRFDAKHYAEPDRSDLMDALEGFIHQDMSRDTPRTTEEARNFRAAHVVLHALEWWCPGMVEAAMRD